MHTFVANNGTLFHHNGDGSGDVIIQLNGKEIEITIPADDLFEFVADIVRNAKIAALEAAEDVDILGVRDTDLARIILPIDSTRSWRW